MSRRPAPNRLGMYDDVRTILDAALASGGGSITIPGETPERAHGAAVHWRQRAYRFRKLYAETIATTNSTAMSPYDKLTMPRIDPDSSTVVIRVREVVGKFVPNSPPEVFEPILAGDELFDVARELADKLAKES